MESFNASARMHGNEANVLRAALGSFREFAEADAVPVPRRQDALDALVSREDRSVFLKPNGFFLWQTREEVGTPETDPRYICFVDGKSTRARLGLVVHLTAPTIHAGWWGNITLEIANLGPFTLRLDEGDIVAQVVVSTISSTPTAKETPRGIPAGQASVAGSGKPAKRRGK